MRLGSRSPKDADAAVATRQAYEAELAAFKHADNWKKYERVVKPEKKVKVKKIVKKVGPQPPSKPE